MLPPFKMWLVNNAMIKKEVAFISYYLLHLQGDKGEPGGKGDTGNSVSYHPRIFAFKKQGAELTYHCIISIPVETVSQNVLSSELKDFSLQDRRKSQSRCVS